MNLQWTHDAKYVAQKWSTWLSVTAGGISAACGAALLVYAGLPEGAQATVDASLLGLLSKLMMGSAAVSALIPFATSIQQKMIPKP